MAWTYNQNFDSLNNGTLSGQDSWSKNSGTGDWQVIDTESFAGDKCLSGNLISTVYQRTISATTSGSFFFAFKATTIATGDVFFSIDDGNTYGIQFKMNRISDTTYKMQQYVPGYEDVSGTLDKDTWYIGELQYDTSTDEMRFRTKTSGGTWSSFSSWKSFQRAQGSLTRFRFGVDPLWVTYFDEFSDTDPDVGGSPYTLTVDTMAVASTFNAVVFTFARKLVVATMAVVNTFNDVTLTWVRAGITLAVDTMAVAVTNNVVTLRKAYKVVFDTMAVTSTFNAVNFAWTRAYSLVVDTMSVISTFFDVNLKIPGRWINKTKNTSTYTNKAKNTSTWTNLTKN